ncbi:hypothetical protein ACIQ7D_25750 [Streptomyces sp. NPDC096310]|uniref:hypothetical protein n=1 Tax=Streptomyces sp. NPDC096310 TaxID=3366082 RepID=UPI00380CC627
MAYGASRLRRTGRGRSGPWLALLRTEAAAYTARCPPPRTPRQPRPYAARSA